VNQLAKKLLEALPAPGRIVALNSMYRTKYPNPDELYQVPDGQTPMKTFKSSFVSAEDSAWLTSKVGTPAHFMAPCGGLAAALLMQCEMHGKSGFQITAITDGHYVTAESMQALLPLTTYLGLTTQVTDFFDAIRDPKHRDTLREANQRGNTIYC